MFCCLPGFWGRVEGPPDLGRKQEQVHQQKWGSISPFKALPSLMSKQSFPTGLTSFPLVFPFLYPFALQSHGLIFRSHAVGSAFPLCSCSQGSATSLPCSNRTHPQAPLKRCLLPKVFIAWKSDLPPLPPRPGLTLCGLPSNADICEQTFFPLWGRKRPLKAEGDPWLIYLQIPSTSLDQRRAQ